MRFYTTPHRYYCGIDLPTAGAPRVVSPVRCAPRGDDAAPSGPARPVREGGYDLTTPEVARASSRLVVADSASGSGRSLKWRGCR